MGIRACLVPVLVTMSGVAAAGADRTPASVPLSIDGKGGIVVDVRINAAGPFRFMLDTGAARSLVSEDLAREIAAPAVAKSEVVTSAGSDLRLVVRLTSLAMASATADDSVGGRRARPRTSRDSATESADCWARIFSRRSTIHSTIGAAGSRGTSRWPATRRAPPG